MAWQEYPNLPQTDDNSRDIIEALFANKDTFFQFERDIDTNRTKLIKRVLKDLWQTKGCKVYANEQDHFPDDVIPFVNKEWLYDIHCYTDEDFFLPTSLPLIVECEWRNILDKGKIREGEYYREGANKIPYSAVMYDFQKLLVSNADLRLMVYKTRTITDLETMLTYFQNAIRKYPNLQPGDKFLIVAYYESSKQIYYKQLEK